MTASIAVLHKFETGHRLPHVPGKCQSLHGHSWHVRVEVAAPALDDRGMVVEFGPFKQQLRWWIDTQLDHGLMIGHQDPLLQVLSDAGKVYPFTEADGDWPTVENVAFLIARIAANVVDTTPHARGAHVARVDVMETAVNTASWTPERAR